MPSDQPIYDEPALSLGEHLDELRRRLVWAFAAPIPLVFVIFFFSEWIIVWLSTPLAAALRAQGLPPTLQQLGPVEYFGQQLKLSLIGALVLSGPWILWQAWLFIRPGLYAHERRFATLLLPLSAVMTLAGAALTIWVMLPLMLSVLVGLGTDVKAPDDPATHDPAVMAILRNLESVPIRIFPQENPQPNTAWTLLSGAKLELYVALPATGAGDAAGAVEIRRVSPPNQRLIDQTYQLSNYISFVLLMLLGTVLAFQMPPVIMLLGWLHLASVPWLRSQRRYAILICAVAAAIITPSSDPFSMFVMMVPLYALYELSIVLLVLAPAKKVASGTLFSLRRAGETVARGTRAKKPGDTPPSHESSTDLFDKPRDEEGDP